MYTMYTKLIITMNVCCINCDHNYTCTCIIIVHKYTVHCTFTCIVVHCLTVVPGPVGCVLSAPGLLPWTEPELELDQHWWCDHPTERWVWLSSFLHQSAKFEKYM